jgi:hypothetical protein
MVISHLVLLFPFAAYLTKFLVPDKVVTMIMEGGLRSAADALNTHGRCITSPEFILNLSGTSIDSK